jgi:hypothetical protein
MGTDDLHLHKRRPELARRGGWGPRPRQLSETAAAARPRQRRGAQRLTGPERDDKLSIRSQGRWGFKTSSPGPAGGGPGRWRAARAALAGGLIGRRGQGLGALWLLGVGGLTTLLVGTAKGGQGRARGGGCRGGRARGAGAGLVGASCCGCPTPRAAGAKSGQWRDAMAKAPLRAQETRGRGGLAGAAAGRHEPPARCPCAGRPRRPATGSWARRGPALKRHVQAGAGRAVERGRRG